MKLNPRYDDAPAVDMAVDPATVRDAFLRQRRRLVDTVSSLSDEQLATKSRCDEWTVAGVCLHLIDVDRFWTVSLASGVGGTPTRFLADFDPEATPRELVEGRGDVSPAEVRAQFAETTTAFCDAVNVLDDDAWTRTAEAPPGHVTINSMVHHALWDAWIHERDIGIPLGLDLVEEADEVAASLTYAAGLSPAFGVRNDPSRSGMLGIRATDPDVALKVDIGHTTTVTHIDASTALSEGVPVLTGRAADLAEALSVRAELDAGDVDASRLDADDRWMVDGLAEVFQPAASQQ